LIPIRFGAANRQLFGLYQAPLQTASRGESILLCAPFGQEAIRSHRLFKILADRLCRDGFHVLRFDYFGTGDSAGEGDEVSIESFVTDVLTASNELMDRSGCTRSAWVGLRLGATIAAMASAHVRPVPSRLILWEPVTDGARYLAELAEAHAATMVVAYGWRVSSDACLRDAIAREAGFEALGFPLTDGFRAALKLLSVHSFATVQASVVNIFENTVDGVAGVGEAGTELAGNLITRGLPTRVKRITDPVVWTADDMMNAASVPGEVLQQIVACFATTSPDPANFNVAL
jgi:uncharacterized protein